MYGPVLSNVFAVKDTDRFHHKETPMADTHGAVISNVFAVDDVQGFRDWLVEFNFGGYAEITVAVVDEPREKTPATVMLHAWEPYLSALPHKRATRNGEDPVSEEVNEKVDIDAWTQTLREHLVEGEVFYLIATGTEAGRYNEREELAVSHDGSARRSAASDVDEDARRLIKEKHAAAK